MIVNFGGNVRFEPTAIVRPIDLNAILEILPGAETPVRVAGSLHSWSPLVETKGTLVDLSHFTELEILGGSPPKARIGAGAKLDYVLKRLAEHGYTLPTVGAVKEQTLAGAISTGTHGSGRPSLSSYVAGVELVTLDEEGNAAIRRIEEGVDLEAARCSLGALGVITSVDIEIVPRYGVTESFVERSRLQDILAEGEEWPLQQFFLLPWAWRWFSFRRKVSEERSHPIRRIAWKSFNVAWVDWAAHAFHKGAIAVQKAGSDRVVKRMLKDVFPRSLITGVEVTDDSETILTMNHHWFRHLETELFLPGPHLREAFDVIEYLTRTFGGEETRSSRRVAEVLAAAGVEEEVKGMRGVHTHHYPFFVRRVLRDSTLISMSSPLKDEEEWYSISLFSYMEPRDSFFEFAKMVSRIMVDRFDARLHWGKYIPLSPATVAERYPRIDLFREVVSKYDPNGTFSNEMIERYLERTEERS